MGIRGVKKKKKACRVRTTVFNVLFWIIARPGASAIEPAGPQHPSPVQREKLSEGEGEVGGGGTDRNEGSERK